MVTEDDFALAFCRKLVELFPDGIGCPDPGGCIDGEAFGKDHERGIVEDSRLGVTHSACGGTGINPAAHAEAARIIRRDRAEVLRWAAGQLTDMVIAGSDGDYLEAAELSQLAILELSDKMESDERSR